MDNNNTDVSTEFSLLESLREAGMTAGVYVMGTVCALGQVGALSDIKSKAEEAFPGMGDEERELATIVGLQEATQILMKDPNIQPPLNPNSQTPPPAGQLAFRLMNNENIDLSGLSDQQRASVEIVSGYMRVGQEAGACIINNMGGGEIDPVVQPNNMFSTPTTNSQPNTLPQTPLSDMNFNGDDATFSGDTSLGREVSQIMEVNPNAVPAITEQVIPSDDLQNRLTDMSI